MQEDHWQTIEKNRKSQRNMVEIKVQEPISEEQLYLLSCVFAARSDAASLKEVLKVVENPKDVYSAVCVLWPELDDPSNLEFLFHSQAENSVDHNDLLVSLLGADSKLIPITEMDITTVSERVERTKDYIGKRMETVGLNSNFKLQNFKSEWLRSRIILVDDIQPQNTVLYKGLWQELINDDPELAKWINGVVEPLIHFNRRTCVSIRIKDFENMDYQKVFDLMLEDRKRLQSTVITREVVPYLKNHSLEDFFLENIFTIESFPFSSHEDYKLFSQLLHELTTPSPSMFNKKLQRKALCIIFENSSNLLKVGTKENLVNMLREIDDDVPVGDYDLTARSLKLYSRYLNTFLLNYDLKSIYGITKEEESAQAAHFVSLIKEMLLQIRRNPLAMNSIFELMNTSNLEEHKIFTHLTKAKQTSILIETSLSLGEFDLLREFVVKYDSTIEEGVLLKYFWHFFNNASNGLSTRPEMIKAEKTLNLLLPTDNEKYGHLQILLDIANELSEYSLNLGKGVPFEPSDILSFRSKPFDLISILLELNHGLYKNISTTSALLKKLKGALEISGSDNNVLTREEQARLLSVHIDHSLVEMDFTFAVEKTKDLFTFDHISQFWVTVFQVGKFIDPCWKDGEIPTEILLIQLEILGDLLHVCPIEEVEVITSQWSSLELELMTRDIMNDPYSLKNQTGPNRIIASEVLLRGVSSTLSSLLSGT